MPELLNQDSCECICFYCCPYDSPAVYMAFIIEAILLKSYLAQKLHVYSSFPTLLSDFFDKWCETVHYPPTMQTLILPHLPRCSYSHHPQSSDLLYSLVSFIKRRGRCISQINGRSSANKSTSNDTEGFRTKQKVLMQMLQLLSCSSSPSAPLEICDWLKGTFLLRKEGSLLPRY